MFPKKNPEAAKKLLETPDEKLTNAERDKKFMLAIATTPMPCPMCFAKVSVIDAADNTLAVGSGAYHGKYVCPNCETELAKIMTFFMVPGTPKATRRSCRGTWSPPPSARSDRCSAS
jgi:hypothetical protein